MDLPGVHILDVSGEDASLIISAPSSKQYIVWVPIEAQDGRSNGLLEMLRYPPIVLLVE